MKIHLYDDDERKYTDPTYAENHGPFSDISINLNEALKKTPFYSEPNDADFVGFNSGLNLGFSYANKKTFVINVWETSNSLPYYLLQFGGVQRIFGLSDQITNLWKKYGFDVKTVYPGCDTSFWKQTLPKSSVFTFLHVNSSNVRSGLDITLKSFSEAFRGNKDVKLIVKDTNDSPKLKKRIDELVLSGVNIEYISKRMSRSEIRDLYSQSHVCLNLIRITSFGLPLLECSACNCLCITGDVPPTNEIINSKIGVLIKSCGELEFKDKIPSLVNDWGLLNCFPDFKYPEEPRFYDFKEEDYSTKMLEVYNNWNSYCKIDTRTEIVEKWSWEKSAERLIASL